jgi:DNA mismatch repair protein MutS
MFSILFSRPDSADGGLSLDQPSCFPDLNLDQLLKTITAGREEYHLEPFFYTLLGSTEEVRYRHEVFRDLEKEQLLEAIRSFSAGMRAMRQCLALVEKLDYRYEKKRWLLEAIDTYCGAVSALARELGRVQTGSRGFSALREHLGGYQQSEPFRLLQAEAQKLKEELSGVRYCLLINGAVVKVRRYESEKDYATEVESTFAKFRHDPPNNYLVKFQIGKNLNHVEAMALDCVAGVFPDLFARLGDYCERNLQFADPTILRFDREVQVYLCYLELVGKMRRAGLPCCYPRVLNACSELHGKNGYDLVLASRLVEEGAEVVCNDFFLKNEERVIVVTGPNQGGKTTFARAFGQLHFLAALGFPIPGTEAQLPLADGVFAHFGKEESIAELRGKLEDDLIRIRDILEHCTSRSIIVMNEIFTSTTIQDALFLSWNVLERVFEKGTRGVLVTFLDELAAAGPRTVSMVAEVDPRDPGVRTFKVLRAPADGLAYALSLAARHGLTYERIRERVSQ